MTAKLKSLPAIEVAQRLRTGHAVLIDVREADEFARRFLDVLSAAQHDISDALAENSPGDLALIAHRLKSSAEWIGAGGLAAEYDALQTAAAGGDIGEARRRIEEINRLAAAIRSQLGSA